MNLANDGFAVLAILVLALVVIVQTAWAISHPKIDPTGDEEVRASRRRVLAELAEIERTRPHHLCDPEP